LVLLNKEQLHVLSNDSSQYQADHKSIKTNCLQLHWWLEISNLTNVLLYAYNIYDM